MTSDTQRGILKKEYRTDVFHVFNRLTNRNEILNQTVIISVGNTLTLQILKGKE